MHVHEASPFNKNTTNGTVIQEGERKMARKKGVEFHELMAAAEKILMEKGYTAFHFRLLAEELGVGRSTIYDYFSSKDELVIAYIHQFMYERIKECEALMRTGTIEEQLRGFLKIFIKHSCIEQMTTMIIQMDKEKKNPNAEGIQRIKELARKLYEISLQLIQDAKDKGAIRKELDETFISYLIFNLVKIPNYRSIPDDERIEELIHVFFCGVGTG